MARVVRCRTLVTISSVELSRAANAEWTIVGSELEALLREAMLIAKLPSADAQLTGKSPQTLQNDRINAAEMLRLILSPKRSCTLITDCLGRRIQGGRSCGSVGLDV